MGSPEVVVNDVLVDPRNACCCTATDRSGVLASDDSATTFTASNHGYSHRYVSANFRLITEEPNTLYIGLVNDREFGGVFLTRDGGQNWLQKSSGLDGRDVFHSETIP